MPGPVSGLAGIARVCEAMQFAAFPRFVVTSVADGKPAAYRCGGSAGFSPASRFTRGAALFNAAALGTQAARIVDLRGQKFLGCRSAPLMLCAPQARGWTMYSEQLGVAQQAAAAAAEVIREAYRSDFSVRYKGDDSPVTEVDEAAEAAIKAVILGAFPDHGFYGEELGQQNLDAEFLWLVDPIDGTKSFVRGYPVFSTQIALMHRGELVVGVSSAPCWNGGAGELLHAAKGHGAWLGDQCLWISPVERLDRATLSTGNLNALADSPAWARFGELVPKLHRLRGYGDFLHYHWLASGKLDVVMESNVNILDIAANVVIVREAGGVFTNLRGGDIELDTTTVLAASPALHPQVLEAIGYESDLV